VYVRVNEDAQALKSGNRDEEAHTPEQIQVLKVRLQELANTTGFNHAKSCTTAGEVGLVDDLERDGFNVVMTHILQRTIDRLVISHPGQVCSAGAWPLFKWLCDTFDVVIVCAESRSASA